MNNHIRNLSNGHRLWRTAVLAVLVAVCGGGAVAFAQDQGSSSEGSAARREAMSKLPADVRELAEKFDRVWSRASDLQADFVQRKHTPLLKKPLLSHGRLLMAQGMIRWDTLKPTRTQTLIAGSEVRIYDPEFKRMEIYSFDAAKSGMPMGQFGASPMPRFSDLAEQFDIQRLPLDGENDEQEEATVALRLTPRDETMREQVEQMTMRLDAESGHLREMRIDHGDGEYTVYAFSDVKLNEGLTAEDVKIKLPRGVKVVRPYDD